MGTSTIFDIISSTIVAGILFLMALRLNLQANETTAVYNANLILQQNMTSLVGIIEHDFRAIGYCADYTKIPDPSLSIRKADSTEIRFWTDVNNDGNLDSIRYYVGPTSELNDTPNPNDRKLYRVINNQPVEGWNFGVTQFRFKYFDAEGDTLIFPILDPREVYTMEITIAVESPAPYKTEFMQEEAAKADFQQFWRQLRLAARNLRNR